MLNRRKFLSASALVAGSSLWTAPARASEARLVFIHGRAQEGRKPDDVKAEWVGALKEGLAKNGKTLATTQSIELPYYGDLLADFAKQAEIPLAADIKARGGPETDEFLQFQAEFADEIRVERGITDQQVNAEYGDNPKERGPLNWEWVQAIVSAVDKHGGGLSSAALQQVTRDVFLYTNYPVVRDAVDKIVRAAIGTEPTVIIGHSLGSVVAYSVLQTDTRPLDVKLVTVGCPLAIRAIRRRFSPIKYPVRVKDWKNAFDTRDIVALYPLDKDNFNVTPAIENFGGIKNKTDNRHGISGYLDDAKVADWIADDLGF